ncbi:hypothetical protein SmJEL517_g04935 [Synchytrium microbalum]|uniref:CS domain-containing protein n=1 Tax=Synchytrium microbalum TaxID=1806994 RepID=A0A507BPC1_9FUNG|nr:uncharacterized protein SmJEL517_g04935 [Synchytrium microbalum]TPX31840.1 hypothetical protein SmJEL517_g04935 [Synchytrium microbalum]
MAAATAVRVAPNEKTLALFIGGEPYIWSQSDEDSSLTLQACLPRNTKAKDVQVDYSDDHVVVTILESNVRVQGKLYGSINKHDLVWQLETTPKDGRRVLTVNMEKLVETRWPTLIVEPINGNIDPHSLYLLAEGDLASARISTNQAESLQFNIDALAKLTKAAEQDNIPAILRLAAWYQFGAEASNAIPVKKDLEKGFELHLKAAELGNCEACYIVGCSFANISGDSIKVSYPDAIVWWTNCLNYDDHLADHSRALYVSAAWQAGLLLLKGGDKLGDPAPEKALTYWKISGSQGHPPSMYNIGLLLMNGWGTATTDVAAGVKLIASAVSIDPSKVLTLPPQLEGLTPVELEKLIEMARENKEELVHVLVDKVKAEQKAAEDKTLKKKKKRKSSKKVDQTGLSTTTIVVGVVGVVALTAAVGYLAYRYGERRTS